MKRARVHRAAATLPLQGAEMNRSLKSTFEGKPSAFFGVLIGDFFSIERQSGNWEPVSASFLECSVQMFRCIFLNAKTNYALPAKSWPPEDEQAP